MSSVSVFGGFEFAIRAFQGARPIATSPLISTVREADR